MLVRVTLRVVAPVTLDKVISAIHLPLLSQCRGSRLSG